MKFLQRLFRTILIFITVAAAAVICLFLWSLAFPPVPPVRLVSKPHPAADYAEALARFDRLLASDKARGDLDPQCLPVLLTHGRKTARVIVLLHSLTACPYQYHQLGKLFFDQGYNVYIPRLPDHGLADRTSNALKDLTAGQLADTIDPTLDIAAGLGDHITITGLSLGGVLTALAGQLRPDVQLAAPISPAFGLRFVPDFLTPTITRLLLGLPDTYLWWDPIDQNAFPGESGYPGFSSHALGQILRLGMALRKLAGEQGPRARQLLVITNWGDPAVNLEAADSLVDAWRGHGGSVQGFRLALLPWLPHDFISPDAPFQKTDVVYPQLVELLSTFH